MTTLDYLFLAPTLAVGSAAALHAEVKALHEGIALGLVEPGKAKTHQQARHAHQRDHPRRARRATRPH